MHFVRLFMSKDEFIYITAFTVNLIQDTLQGVFLFTKFGVLLLILKLLEHVELLTDMCVLL